VGSKLFMQTHKAILIVFFPFQLFDFRFFKNAMRYLFRANSGEEGPNIEIGIYSIVDFRTLPKAANVKQSTVPSHSLPVPSSWMIALSLSLFALKDVGWPIASIMQGKPPARQSVASNLI